MQARGHMRSIWSGTISFGLVQVPVQLVGATRDLGVHFRLVDSRDQHAIRYERVNTATGEEVPWKQVAKAYEVRKGHFLIVDEDELKRAAPEQTETIELEAFVDRCDVDPIYFEKPYYVMPAKRGGKGYVVLRQALADSGKIGIARVVIRTRQYLAALHPEKDALMLTLMRFAQEVIEPAQIGVAAAAGHPKVRAEELAMAHKLLASMSRPWRPADYKDELRPKLKQLLERRAKHGTTAEPAERPADKAEAGKVLDLMGLLQRSLASNDAGKPGKRAPRRPRAKPARARRRAS